MANQKLTQEQIAKLTPGTKVQVNNVIRGWIDAEVL